jgi:hypothetical protein
MYTEKFGAAYESKRRKRKVVERVAAGLCTACGKVPATIKRKTCVVCREANRVEASQLRHAQGWKEYNKVYNKVRRLKIKKIVLEHYGNKCVCCGETNEAFLTLDHINNDGAKQRQKHRSAGGVLHNYIVKHGFPTDIQLLCYNCNCGKFVNGGICPHLTVNAMEGIDTSVPKLLAASQKERFLSLQSVPLVVN